MSTVANRVMDGPAGPVRRYPIGAELVSSGVSFRVWAPGKERLSVMIEDAGEHPLTPGEDGYFEGVVPGLGAGSLYRFRIDGNDPFPDPASRFQPGGVHGPSLVIDPQSYRWRDGAWAGVRMKGQVIYEMHIGTFTPEGTWAAAGAHLSVLADLGITVLEVMPVAEFPGRFGWGYDGVDLFAPTRLYGSPDDFRHFVDTAHALGLGVILDVVYNHLGPDGNYLKCFAPAYFTSRYENEWGEPLNFDGDDAGPVRDFFTSNAAYWIDEFHLDGLRLDATQQMFDASERHILLDVAQVVRRAAGHRRTIIVSENEPQHVRLLRDEAAGGYGHDALWNDDFHHLARVAATGRNEAYYTDYTGTPQEFVSAAKYGPLYQGQWYHWQHKPRGTPAFGLGPERFVSYLQNHDQVANTGRGERLQRLTSPGRLRALTALMLLMPSTPMLFQGQEFAASTPFLYFADHEPGLASAVAAGRQEFLEQFPSIADTAMAPCLNDPADRRTFEACKLDHGERQRNAEAVRLHRDLLRLRREDAVFRTQAPNALDGAVLAPEAFVLRFFGANGDDRLLLVNLGRRLPLSPAPEPLLAPPGGAAWRLLWSSEHPDYGGGGTPRPLPGRPWPLPAHSALVLAPEMAPP